MARSQIFSVSSSSDRKDEVDLIPEERSSRAGNLATEFPENVLCEVEEVNKDPELDCFELTTVPVTSKVPFSSGGGGDLEVTKVPKLVLEFGSSSF